MRKWCRINILWNVKNKKRGTNLKKQDKRNWPKAAIQILSFLLLTGLFEAQFSAVGTIVSAVYQGTVSWERIRYSVFGMDAAGDGSGGDYCGKVFLRIFLQLRGCAGFSVVCRE